MGKNCLVNKRSFPRCICLDEANGHALPSAWFVLFPPLLSLTVILSLQDRGRYLYHLLGCPAEGLLQAFREMKASDDSAPGKVNAISQCS